MKPDRAIVALRTALEGRLGDLADEATEKILAELPAYRGAEQQLRDDVHAHVVSHLRASLGTLGADRDLTSDDLLFVRPHAARRARRVPVAEFVRAFYIGEQVLWDAALALATDEDSRRAALAFATHLPRYFEVATTHAAEVYVETEQQLASTGERIRRDLLEDLLACRPLEPGPRADAARAAGLRDDGQFVVLSARPCAEGVQEQLLRGGAVALARATRGRSGEPLAVVRREEIIVVAATRALPHERLTTAQRRLAGSGLPLVVGVSTILTGLQLVPDGYREASAARAEQGSMPGVLDLGAMTAFDYLTMRPDATAARLISPAIHEFIASDMADGGTLVGTLRHYVACDLNARRAAGELHIHVNTAHYRLGKVAERTGCDLRRVQELTEILIAARMADAAARRRSQA